MDAKAHLISLGWAGPGHALDSKPQYKQKGHRGLAYDPALDPLKVGNTGNGLVKPLSISRRKERFGLGKKSHEPPAGTEWWLKGFESALGNIGKSESERSGTSTPVMGAPGKHNGLYGFFVKGQVMEGTISEMMLQRSQGKKRKSDAMDVDDSLDQDASSKKQRLTGFEVSPVRRKPETALDFATVGAFIKERDKEEKRRKKKGASSAIDQFAQIGQFFAEGDGAQKAKKSKNGGGNTLIENASDDAEDRRAETKEERRERRRKRREEKAHWKNVVGADDRSEDEAAKAARRAERKRRKAEKEARKS